MAAKLLVPQNHIKTHPSSIYALLGLQLQLATRAGLQPVEDLRIVQAFVGDGCWRVDCPNCGSGIAIDPEWENNAAVCLGVGCYRIYRNLIVRADWREVEDALLLRAQRIERQCLVGESVQKLVDEYTARETEKVAEVARLQAAAAERAEAIQREQEQKEDPKDPPTDPIDTPGEGVR